ncbi:hypothetical protein KCV01_g18833, partial [Aureobasidium melanogenum]
MLVGAPLLLTALAVGLLIGMVQAATQINEQTLSFIPKLIAMSLVMIITGPWMLRGALMPFDVGQLEAWVGSACWAMARVSGLMLVAPVLGATTIPGR